MAKQTVGAVSTRSDSSPKHSNPDNGDHATDLKRVFTECSNQAQAIKCDIRNVLDQKLARDEHTELAGETNGVNNETRFGFESAIRSKIDGLETALRTLNVVKMCDTDIESQCSPTEESVSENSSCEEKSERTAERVTKIKSSSRPVPSTNADSCCSNLCERSNCTEKIENNVKNPKNKKSKGKEIVRKDVREKLTSEMVLKSLSSSTSDSEKLEILCKKYADLFNDHKTLESNSKQHEKICLQLMKEREQLQSEHNRVVLVKDKLENLCRELQKHSRTVKEETLIRIKEEEEKHRKVATKFQETLSDIMGLIKENQQRSESLREENRDLAGKMKALMDHYDKWEKNIEKIMKQKELETQIMNAKLAKTSLLHNEEKKLFLNEKETLINLMADLQKRTNDSTTNEMQLRAELALYTSKYDEFQTVLSKSNEMFISFKKDMERMAKQIKKLERETVQWKNKWESCNRALVILSEEKQKRDNDYLNSLQKIQTLEKLCRAMQEERIQMQTKLKQFDDLPKLTDLSNVDT
ncbi:gamma-taxilin-like protein [Leptotrombidium deliense]|uniref:Gamma-taxilin-like protein n=1 Tax=Leptotrombidium deliense TaxID=299467 RepID=A0A443SFL9_9ACAR|nr:gamma-taxilin-like protein [Leptotrombidium deliense]